MKEMGPSAEPRCLKTQRRLRVDINETGGNSPKDAARLRVEANETGERPPNDAVRGRGSGLAWSCLADSRDRGLAVVVPAETGRPDSITPGC